MEFPFFRKVASKIKQYVGLIDDVIVDTLVDLKSQRHQLIIWAFILNFLVLFLVYLGKADYKLSAVAMGLLTVVYAFFFKSRDQQAKLEADSALEEQDSEPSVEKDPDKI